MKKFFKNLFKNTRETADKISENEKVKNVLQKAQEFAEDVAERAVDFAEDVSEKAKKLADKAMDNESVKKAVDTAKHTAGDVAQKAKHMADKAMENESVKKAVDKVHQTKEKFMESEFVKNTRNTAKTAGEDITHKTEEVVDKMANRGKSEEEE